MVLKGRVEEPAVPPERGEAPRVTKAKKEDVKKCPSGHTLVNFATTSDGWVCSSCERDYPENSLFRRCPQCDYDLCAACWCLAKRPGDKETDEEAPPPPPPGKPKSRRSRGVKDDDEAPPPPPPGKPPKFVKSSRNKMKDEAEGRVAEPAEASEPAASPTITFPWGSWICNLCKGVITSHSQESACTSLGV